MIATCGYHSLALTATRLFLFLSGSMVCGGEVFLDFVCAAGMCLEKRAFYRMISGLHTSINIHLCDQYLFPGQYLHYHHHHHHIYIYMRLGSNRPNQINREG